MSSNPDFLVQDNSNFTPIRYYTAYDPYYYLIDNRPLQDIETNLKADRSGGADAARRAALFNAMVASGVMKDLYTAPAGATRMSVGLDVNLPSTNLIRISPGAVYEQRAVSTGVTDLIMKQALITKNTDFTLTPPVAVGTSVVYTVEAQFVELTSTTIGSTQLPNLDSNNQYLPSTILHGELKLNLVVGTVAATGSELPVATTAGHFPLYNLTLTQGVNNPKVWAHANAPYRKGMNRNINPMFLTGSNATAQVINEIPAFTFSTTGTAGVILPVNGSLSDANPYVPIKIRMVFSTSTAGGAVAFRTRYKGYLSGEAHTVTGSTSIIEPITYTGSMNSIQTSSTATAVIPASEFADFVGGVWKVNKDKLNIILERIGDDASDTNTGTLNLFNVVLYQ